MVDVTGGQTGVLQAVADRPFGELVRIVEGRFLAVLDAIEPLLLHGRDELAVDQQRGR